MISCSSESRQQIAFMANNTNESKDQLNFIGKECSEFSCYYWFGHHTKSSLQPYCSTRHEANAFDDFIKQRISRTAPLYRTFKPLENMPPPRMRVNQLMSALNNFTVAAIRFSICTGTSDTRHSFTPYNSYCYYTQVHCLYDFKNK